MDKSFEILIGELRPMMLSYASALLSGDAHQAEDVVQEACLTAYQNLDRFDEGRSFPKWIRGIVRNKVLESRRGASRRPLVQDPTVIAGMEDVFGMFDRPRADEGWLDRIELLRHCINRLRRPMRDVVKLFYQSGLSLDEVGRKLGIQSVTAGQRLSRSRKQIRVCVAARLRVDNP